MTTDAMRSGAAAATGAGSKAAKGGRFRWLAIVGIVLLALGLAGWIMQLTGGLLGGSGMTDIFLWGLMIAMFAFMVGFGAGSQLVASAIYLFGKDELKPLARVAAAVGLACVGAAGVAILADLGAIRNIMAMIVGLNLRSPLAWDMIALTAFIVVSVIQLVVMARGGASTRAWVILAGVVAVVLQVVEGLLFSTQTAHEWWASPIMPVDFLVVAFVSGSALMMLVAWARGCAGPALAWLGRLCAWAIAVHLVLALCDLAMVAVAGTPVAGGVMGALGATWWLYLGELLLPAVAMVLLFAAGRGAGKPGDAAFQPADDGQCQGVDRQDPLAFEALGEEAAGVPQAEADEGLDAHGAAIDADAANERLRKFSLWAGVLVIVGIFCHRLMLLYPAYNAPSLYLTLSGTDLTTGPYPISTGRYLDWDTTFALGTAYVPAALEWLAALLPLGVAVVATFAILWVMAKLGKGAKSE